MDSNWEYVHFRFRLRLYGCKCAMSFGVVSVTAETDCSLTVPLSVTAVSGKTAFGRSLDRWDRCLNELVRYVEK